MVLPQHTQLASALQLRLPNMDDNFYEVDTVQKCAVGTRIVDEYDGRVFRYALAGATLNPDLGAKSYDQQHIAFTTVAQTQAVGDKIVRLTVAGTDGDAGNGAIARDEMVGGYVVIFPHSANTMVRRIVGNTPVAAGGGTIELQLDLPLNQAITVTVDHGEAMASPYLDVRCTAEATSSVLGLPVAPATAGQWTWLQTWGPCWIAPQGDVSVGNNNREVVFRHDGSIDTHTYNDVNVALAQHAGFVIQNARGGGQGAPFIMLQISP